MSSSQETLTTISSNDEEPNLFPTQPDPSDPWFDDGNIILQAGTKLFRIPKGVLAARSPIFHDLFSLPQPPNSAEGEDIFDGCPLVQLPDDEDDVRYFLMAIYDSSYFEPPPRKVHMKAVLGILRLGAKYEVGYLRRRALCHLDTAYPTTLAAFDKHPEAARSIMLHPGETLRFQITDLVRTVNALWLLPCLLYLCCSVYDIQTIINGDASTRPMGWENQLSCIYALVPLDRARLQENGVIRFLTMEVPGCRDRMRCMNQKMALLRSFTKNGDKPSNPLYTFRKPGSWDHYLTLVCPHCVDSAKADNASAREEVWRSLPRMFNLPPWDDLLEMRKMDLDLTSAI